MVTTTLAFAQTPASPAASPDAASAPAAAPPPLAAATPAIAATPPPVAAATAPAPASADAPEPVSAEEGERIATEKKEPHSVSVTFSPLHLLFPEFKAMVEGKVSRKFGVAVIGGIGSVKVDGTAFTVWEAGAQAKYYLVGSFQHGMELGAQVEYAGVSGSKSSADVSVSGNAGGFAVGPFIGYKLATKIGFTCDLQAGAQYAAVGASASSSTGHSASAHSSELLPLLNLHVGWSF